MSNYRILAMVGAAIVLVAAACSSSVAPKPSSQPPPEAEITVADPTTTLTGFPWATGATWAWYLGGGTIPQTNVDILDVDLFETSRSDVTRIEESGIRTVCYVSAGTFEPDRPDASDYPEELLGNTWDEWNERYVDIRRLDLLGPILRARLDLCVSKGFSAVEPDNIDTYGTDTGFDLTESDAIAFARWISDEAHARGLAIAQKNAPELAQDLIDSFDFAITEDCFDDGWCVQMSPYREVGKAVLDAEYTDRMDSLSTDVCSQTETLGVSVLLADRDLTENLERCP